MLKLYEITANYLETLDVFTDPENDIAPEVVTSTLETMEGLFEEKAVQIAAFAKQMEAEAEAIKAVIDGMQRRQKALETRARWLRDYVKIGMETMGRKKLESPWFLLSIAKNPPAVEVFDESKIPQEYRRTIIEYRTDKAAIKEAIGAGVEVPGARMVNGTRLAIK